jgi:hypothetical protein
MTNASLSIRVIGVQEEVTGSVGIEDRALGATNPFGDERL